MNFAGVFEQSKRLLRGSAAIALVDQVVASGTRFTTTVLVGRFGSDLELGYYSLAFSVFVLIVGFQESFISVPYTVFHRQLNDHDRKRYATHCLLHAILLNLLAMAALAITCWILQWVGRSGGVIDVLRVLVFLLPLLMLREYARRFAFAHLRFSVALVLDVVVCLVQVGGLLVLVREDQMTAWGAYVIAAFACGIGTLAWFAISRSEFAWDLSRTTEFVPKNVRFGKWVAGSQVVTIAQTYFAHWMLASVIDERATGAFAACTTVVMLANPFVLGMSNVLSPKAAHAFADGGASATREVVRRFLIVISLALFAYTAVVALFGNRLLVLIFDQQFDGYGSTVGVLALGTLSLGVNFCMASGLRAINRPAANFWASIVGLVVTVVLSLLLVQPLQIFAAAIGLTVGSYVMALYRWLAFRAAIRELASTPSR